MYAVATSRPSNPAQLVAIPMIDGDDPNGTTVELFIGAIWALTIKCSVPAHLSLVTSLTSSRTRSGWPISTAACWASGCRTGSRTTSFFLRCNPDHHTVNFIRGSKIKMHHIAFEMKDFAHIQDACELLALRKMPTGALCVMARAITSSGRRHYRRSLLTCSNGHGPCPAHRCDPSPALR